jgi:hypothetical protein
VKTRVRTQNINIVHGTLNLGILVASIARCWPHRYSVIRPLTLPYVSWSWIKEHVPDWLRL